MKWKKKRLSNKQKPDINYILHHFIKMTFCLVWIRKEHFCNYFLV